MNSPTLFLREGASGYMFRPRVLSDEQKKNLRHWGMELVVVVVGVLLALWAQEWVEGRRQATEDAHVMAALKEEVAYNLDVLARFTALDRCTTERMAAVRKLLEADGENWPGSQDPNGQIDGALYPLMIRMPGLSPVTSQFDRAVESGAMERSGQTEFLKPAYKWLDLFADARDAWVKTNWQLSVLTRPGKLSREQRLEFLQLLGLLDGNMITLRQTAAALPQILPAGYINNVEQLQQQFEEGLPELSKGRENCIVNVDVMTGKPKS